MRITWTREALRALGVQTDLGTAGSIFGLSRTQSYEAHKRGDFPVSVIRVGRRLVVPVAPILELLCIPADTETAGPPSPAADTDHAQTPGERPDNNAAICGRRLRAVSG
jgi:hypothetical protein